MRDKLFDHEVRILDTLVKFLLPATWRVVLVGNGSIVCCYNNMFNFFIYVVSNCDVYTSERTIETLSCYSTLSKSQTDNTRFPLLAPKVHSSFLLPRRVDMVVPVQRTPEFRSNCVIRLPVIEPSHPFGW